MKYIITANKCTYQKNGFVGSFVKVFLQIDGSWAAATRFPWSFPSVASAVFAYRKNEFQSVGVGSDQMPRIEGPRGGVYSIYNGRILK